MINLVKGLRKHVLKCSGFCKYNVDFEIKKQKALFAPFILKLSNLNNCKELQLFYFQFIAIVTKTLNQFYSIFLVEVYFRFMFSKYRVSPYSIFTVQIIIPNQE